MVHLVLFAYTFVLESFTGLAVTGLSIATLFVVMQATGKVDWEQLLQNQTRFQPAIYLLRRPQTM